MSVLQNKLYPLIRSFGYTTAGQTQELVDAVESVLVEQAEALKDAARYRWIRSRVGVERTNGGKGAISSYLYSLKTPPISCMLETDVAIDAAIASAGGGV